MIYPNKSLKRTGAVLASAGLLLSLAGCGETKSDAEHERAARLAVAARSVCDLTGVQLDAKPRKDMMLDAGKRDILHVSVATKLKESATAPMAEYANGQPDANRVRWYDLTPSARIEGSDTYQKIGQPRGINALSDNDPHTSFILTPLHGTYPKGAIMAVSVVGRVETYDPNEAKIRLQTAIGTTGCGKLVQTGELDNGAAGWAVQADAPKPADTMTETVS